MIISCESCSRKFLLNDKEIPKEGRMVQCGNCSVIWHQMPDLKTAKTQKQSKSVPPKVKSKENLSIEKVKASDGKTYQFLGNQWAQLLPSGKTGLFAKKKIGMELNRITGRNTINKKIQKGKKDLNPSQVLNDKNKLPDIYKPNKSLGFFGYFFLLILITFMIIGILKTFEDDLISRFPETEYFFQLLYEQLNYMTETIKNIFILAKDLINSY